MILCGLTIEYINCAGYASEKNFFFKAKDIHEAAIETCKCNYSCSFWSRHVIKGEFHDTTTHNSWSIDSHGHTKGDYHREFIEDFFSRWEEETEKCI